MRDEIQSGLQVDAMLETIITPTWIGVRGHPKHLQRLYPRCARPLLLILTADNTPFLPESEQLVICGPQWKRNHGRTNLMTDNSLCGTESGYGRCSRLGQCSVSVKFTGT